MKFRDAIAVEINALIRDALRYQLAISGPFQLTPESSRTSLRNSELNQFYLHYASSQRLEFDGGIQVNFIVIGDLGRSLLEYAKNNSIRLSVYNLASTDGEEDLALHDVAAADDIDSLHAGLNLAGADEAHLPTIASVVRSHRESNRIGALRTYTALRL